jgi:hypothetical protein
MVNKRDLNIANTDNNRLAVACLYSRAIFRRRPSSGSGEENLIIYQRRSLEQAIIVRCGKTMSLYLQSLRCYSTGYAAKLKANNI